MTQAALWLLVLLPATVGALLAVLPRADRIAAPAALAVATATTALAALVAARRPSVSVPFLAGSGFSLGVDGLSALIVPTVAAVALLVLVFSSGEIDRSQARFHGLMLLFSSGALVTATALTLPTLLFAWELMGATSYALIGFWWRDEYRVAAGLTAFLTTRTADLGMYVAAAAALAGGAGQSLADLPGSSPGWRQVVAAGLLVAALGKAAQLPFSFWLSRAMEGPSPVSALLHSAAMVALGGYLLLRVRPLLAATTWASPTTAWVGALTAVLLGAVAVAQQDLKQLLAASTAAQLGFVVMAAGVGSVNGGAAHLVAHAATKALLFLAAGAWLTALGTKRLSALRGVARRWPLVGWTATAGALSLAGVAPLALWATKDAILSAALDVSPWLYAVGLAGAALSAAYAGKVLVVIWRGRSASGPGSGEEHLDEERPGTRRVSGRQQAPLVVLALGAAVLGVLALRPVEERLARSMGVGAVPAGLPEMAVSAVVALIVLALVWRRYVPEPRWALDWLGLEKAATAIVVRPTIALAQALAYVDDRVLDRAVGGAAGAILAVARTLWTFDDRVLDGGVRVSPRASLRTDAGTDAGADRQVHGVVEGFAALVRRLGRLARRPQTGMLHQYYVQAIAVLAVGVVLLVATR